VVASLKCLPIFCSNTIEYRIRFLQRTKRKKVNQMDHVQIWNFSSHRFSETYVLFYLPLLFSLLLLFSICYGLGKSWVAPVLIGRKSFLFSFVFKSLSAVHVYTFPVSLPSVYVSSFLLSRIYEKTNHVLISVTFSTTSSSEDGTKRIDLKWNDKTEQPLNIKRRFTYVCTIHALQWI